MSAALGVPPITGASAAYAYDYLVLVDLETACDDRSDPNRQEIIEWPWVVYDVAARLAVDHKQVFITPAWNANTNPPPQAVLGLGLDVAFASSLKEAVAHFDAYLFQSFAAHGKSFCLLTDGPWDVRHLLLLEAARKAVRLAPHFRAFFDLRAEFTACYPSAPTPRDRQTMIAALGISLAPSTTGIDDCVAIAEIVSRMLLDGHVFANPYIIPDYDWTEATARVPAVASPIAAAVPVGGIVRLRGLPWLCTEIDIARFLHPIAIVPAGIHFVRNSHGKATGEAFVQLNSEDAVKAALARHRQSMGRRYIEVFKSSPSDMSNHLGRADARRLMHQQHQAHAHVHKAAAVAAAAAAAVAAEAAASHSVRMGHGAHLMYGVRNGPVPVAGRAVVLNRVGKGNETSKSCEVSPERGAAAATGSVTGLAYVVLVSGVPTGSTADELLPIFDGIEMVGNGIHMVPPCTSAKGANGATEHGDDAFVLLTSETWAKKALQRTGYMMKGSPVSIRRSSAAELRQVLGSSSGNSVPFLESNRMDVHKAVAGNGKNRRLPTATSPPRGVTEVTDGKNGRYNYCMQARNVDGLATVDSIAKLFSALGVKGDDVSIAGDVARVSFTSKDTRDVALAEGRLMTNGLRWEEGEAAGQKARENGRVIRMRGLPYSSTEEDIVKFFDGFDIERGGISRGKDRHGRASGEAWVTFRSAGDAQMAVSKLDKAHMGVRYIELLVCGVAR